MKKDIVELAEAFGYDVVRDEPTQKWVRLQPEEAEGFVDVWYGKKGITIGVYNVERDAFAYYKQCSLCLLEEKLVEYTK